VQCIYSPLTFKLLKQAAKSLDLEEAIFTVYGVILEKYLPPIAMDRYASINMHC
jgi:hypothetical protein